ncbi:MAG: hypothetical protein JJ863_32305 [Deltaproteobacteria bacterium]|nr:hypothetical protein [Deltaproteobacteria bacterium]
MEGEGLGLALLIFGPAVLGVILLGLSIFLLVPRRDRERSTIATVFGVILLLGALGIGACYGMMFVGGF